jgi:putative SOS response-associated peptidase YedK
MPVLVRFVRKGQTVAMCGRYVMARAVGDLLADFDAELENEIALEKSWNVAPTDAVPIVLERLIDEDVKRQLHVAKWGLVPSWAKDPKGGARLINARSETLLEKAVLQEGCGGQALRGSCRRLLRMEEG